MPPAAPGNDENVAQVANLRHIFGGELMIMKKVSMAMLTVLCLSLAAWAQTSPLHLKVVGDVQTNKALKVL